MRTLRRNKQPVWYALYTGSKTPVTDSNGLKTGAYTLGYDTPVRCDMSVSGNTGATRLEAPGLTIDFDRTLMTDRMDIPFTIESVFWIDIPYESGVEPNYAAVRVSKTLNSQTILVKRVR